MIQPFDIFKLVDDEEPLLIESEESLLYLGHEMLGHGSDNGPQELPEYQRVHRRVPA